MESVRAEVRTVQSRSADRGPRPWRVGPEPDGANEAGWTVPVAPEPRRRAKRTRRAQDSAPLAGDPSQGAMPVAHNGPVPADAIVPAELPNDPVEAFSLVFGMSEEEMRQVAAEQEATDPEFRDACGWLVKHRDDGMGAPVARLTGILRSKVIDRRLAPIAQRYGTKPFGLRRTLRERRVSVDAVLRAYEEHPELSDLESLLWVSKRP